MIGIKLITFTCDWTEEDRGRTRIEDVKKKHAPREVTFPTGEKGSTRLTSLPGLCIAAVSKKISADVHVFT